MGEVERIKSIFDREFSQWRIKLPADDLEYQHRGELKGGGWRISYVFGENSRGPFLDFLGMHHMEGEPRHKRIYATGEVEILPTYIGFIFHPKDATRQEIKAIEKASTRYNRRVSKLLELKGFNPPYRWEGEKNFELEAEVREESEQLLKMFTGGREES